MLNEIERGQLANSTMQAFSTGDGMLSRFPGLLKKAIQERVWERRIDRGQLYELPNLRALITSDPIAGWGEDPKKIEAVIRDDPEVLAMFRAEMVEQPGKRSKDITDNVSNKPRVETGNSRAYSLARVQKHCAPKIVAQVMAGTMSPNAALVKAGIRKNRQIYIPADPKQLFPKLREVCGDEFIDAAIALEMEGGRLHAEPEERQITTPGTARF